RIAVHGGGGREDDAADAVLAHRRQQVERPADVDPEVAERLPDGDTGLRQAGQVDDAVVAAPHDDVDRRGIGDVAGHEPGLGRDGPGVAGGEVVTHRDVVPRLLELVDDHASEEAGPAHDQDVHSS